MLNQLNLWICREGGKTLWHIQLINNSDTASGNTLLRVVKATEKIKSTQYLNVLNHDIKKKGKWCFCF